MNYRKPSNESRARVSVGESVRLTVVYLAKSRDVRTNERIRVFEHVRVRVTQSRSECRGVVIEGPEAWPKWARTPSPEAPVALGDDISFECDAAWSSP